jgi:hypothetical protein
LAQHTDAASSYSRSTVTFGSLAPIVENTEIIYGSIFHRIPFKLYNLTQMFAAAAINFKMQALRNMSRDLGTQMGHLQK